jgi:hypothetical protein
LRRRVERTASRDEDPKARTTVRGRPLSVAIVIALLCAPSPARADGSRPDSTVFRVWVQPPLAGYTFAFGESPAASGQVHFGAASLALEFSELVVVEAGGGALISPVGGEPSLSFGADAWARAGAIPVIYRSGPSGEGWVLQFASTLGYRYMERGKIVYEDYGVDVEHIQALALDVGPVATYGSARGARFAVRLLSGVIVPIARTHSWNGFMDFPPTQLHLAVPVGLEIGLAF